MADYESEMELTDSTPAPVVVPEPVVPSPEEPKKDEVPVSPAPEVTPVVKMDEPTLYETPDGRKVDAETLTKEWKENFLPEFTRKSQLLADIEREKNLNNPPKDEPVWKNPDYVPKDYAEVIEIAKKEAIQDIRKAYQAEQDQNDSIKKEVETQLSEIRKIDPTFVENDLFVYANKYKFQDLRAAHLSMTDTKKAVVDAEQRTVKNLKTREADPIATVPGGELPENSGYDPNEMSQYEGASEYLAFIKKGKK